MSDSVERLIAEATAAGYFERSVEHQRNNANDVISAAHRFRAAASHMLNDGKVSRSAWGDSPEETLVDRCLHEAEVCMAMATTALCDYMKRTRGVEPKEEGFS